MPWFRSYSRSAVPYSRSGRYSCSGRSRSSNYTAPSSNWKCLTQEEANGPGFKDATYYSTTNAKSKFGLSTDNLRTILGYRSEHKHYGGGNNLTLYRERDLLLFLDRRSGKTCATPEAIEERRLEFRKQQVDQAQAKRDRSNKNSVVPAERLANLQVSRLSEILRHYEGSGCVVGSAKGTSKEWKKTLASRIVKAGYTVEKETLRKKNIRAAEQKARRDIVAQRVQLAKKREEQAKRKEAKIANIAAGKASWDDLNYSELQKECKIRKLLHQGLSSKKVDLLIRIVRYEAETKEERQQTNLLYQEQAKNKRLLDKKEREAVQKARNEAFKAERERQAFLAEEKVKKAKIKREKMEATVALIAAGKAKWEELNNQHLQQQCRKRMLGRPYGNKAAMIERIKKYEALKNGSV